MADRVDLEALADGYEHRPASEAALRRPRRAAAEADLRRGDWAVDVGGGTGVHAAEWVRCGYQAVVVDPSRGMLRRAATRRGVIIVAGRAQALPFASETVGLVYFHLSIHYGDWEVAVDEALRVLRPGGECWVWTLGAEHRRDSFLTRWFPSVAFIDAARFPAPDALAERFAAGGGNVTREREIEVRERPAGEWIEAVESGFVSTLQLLTPEELRAGVEEFEAIHPDRSTIVRYRLLFDVLRTRK